MTPWLSTRQSLSPTGCYARPSPIRRARERRQLHRLGRLVADPAGREMVQRLTDEVLRIPSNRRAARRFADVVARTWAAGFARAESIVVLLSAGAKLAPVVAAGGDAARAPPNPRRDQRGRFAGGGSRSLPSTPRDGGVRGSVCSSIRSASRSSVTTKHDGGSIRCSTSCADPTSTPFRSRHRRSSPTSTCSTSTAASNESASRCARSTAPRWRRSRAGSSTSTWRSTAICS